MNMVERKVTVVIVTALLFVSMVVENTIVKTVMALVFANTVNNVLYALIARVLASVNIIVFDTIVVNARVQVFASMEERKATV